MTIQEFYDETGGNYEDVKSRLLSDERICRFVFKFKDDKSMELLRSSLGKNDFNEAFRAAHTLKGVSQNLAFDRFYVSTNKLTEILREARCMPDDIDELVAVVEEDYKKIMDCIDAIEKN
jgi:HPt (histidine-containing phosphotransfer) domain-containing protein